MIDVLGSDTTLRNLETSLDLLALRHSVVASNIANVDTPGYKALDLDFERELQIALERSTSLETGRERGEFSYTETITPRIVEVRGVTPRLDGNTVSIDEELGKLAQTTSGYTKAAKMMGMKIKMIKSAISG